MPIAVPRSDEPKDDFISRCISQLADTDPDMPNEQRIAICFSQWRDHRESQGVTCIHCGYHEPTPIHYPHETICASCGKRMAEHWDLKIVEAFKLPKVLDDSFKGILARFQNYHGLETGLRRFIDWIQRLRLKPDKPYSMQLVKECYGDYCEAFRWIDEDLIKFIKQDGEAKWYKVVALTANVSMNNNDYTGITSEDAKTLSWRRLNLNHDPNKLLPFPANRVDYAKYEDKGVEAIIRIDNSQKEIQRKIDRGEIPHVSIEGVPRGMKRTEKGNMPIHFNFTALALLERDVALPGDPVTFLEPLILNESLGRRLVESLEIDKRKGEELTEKIKEEEWTPKLIKDLPNSEEYIIEKGIQGMDACSQCIHFKELLNTVKDVPFSTPVEGDADVKIISGGIGKGVGECQVATRILGRSILMRAQDSACTDGRPRSPNSNVQQRTKEDLDMLTEIEYKAEINELQRKIGDYEDKILTEKKETEKQREAKIQTQKELIEITEKLEKSSKDKSLDTSKIVRLEKSITTLREDLDSLKDRNTELEIDIKKLQKDVKYYRAESEKFEKRYDEEKKTRIETDAQLHHVMDKLNNATVKRSQAIQEAQNSQEDKARLQEENAEMIKKLSDKIRETSELAQKLHASAKRELELNDKLNDAKKHDTDKTDSIRELKKEVSKLKDELKNRKKIKIVM